MDLFKKMYKKQQFDMAKETGIYPYFHMLTSGQDTEVEIENIHTIMIGSNNYLGLTSDPSVIEAGIEAMKKYGSGNSGSRFLNGTLDMLSLKNSWQSFYIKMHVLHFLLDFKAILA